MHDAWTVALFLIRHHANKNNTKIIRLVSYAAMQLGAPLTLVAH